MAKILIADYIKAHESELLAQIVKILKGYVRKGKHIPMGVEALAKKLKLVELCHDPDDPTWKGEPDDKMRVTRLVEALAYKSPNVTSQSFERRYSHGLRYRKDGEIAQNKLNEQIETLLEQGADDLKDALIDEGLLERVTVRECPDDPESEVSTELRIAGTTVEAKLMVNEWGKGPYLSFDMGRNYHSTDLHVTRLDMVPTELALMGVLARSEIRIIQETQRRRDAAREAMDEIKILSGLTGYSPDVE